jgi:hypothetical protein
MNLPVDGDADGGRHAVHRIHEHAVAFEVDGDGFTRPSSRLSSSRPANHSQGDRRAARLQS